MMTPADLRKAFEERLQKGIPNPPGQFHPQDLERVKDDKYLQRVIQHTGNVSATPLDILWDLMIWRKTVGANDINESNIRMDYVTDGVFFPRGRDVDGSLLFIYRAKLYVKAQRDFEDTKKTIIYWLERIEREEKGKRISMFFDMDGSGLANMDMDLIKYLVTVFKLYYPSFMNYIIIYQMPWVFQAGFKIIKSLLPAKAIEQIRFVGKDNLKSVVAPEQALSCWGGKDSYVFEFIPEKKSDHTAKKVTFAEQGDSQHSPGEILRLNPNDVIIFKNENDEISGQFTMTNMEESTISFKIRTTSPEKYRVRPSSGTLLKGASQSVSIVVQPGFHLQTVTKDKFLVMAVQIPKSDLSPKELADIWQNSTGSKIDQYRLKCQITDKDVSMNGSVSDGKGEVKQDTVTKQDTLTNLQNNYEMLHRDVRKLKIFQFLTFVMTTTVAVFGYLIFSNTKNINDGYCERM